MKKNIQLLFLLIFTLLVTGLHLYQLGRIPAILNPDEASIAYNAFLLQKTGHDEWGKQWPLVLDAFGDQKLIGYPALVVGAFQVFGAADWVVKVPALLAGSLLIWLMYFLVLQLDGDRKKALTAAMFVGMVPVFFFYSRVAFEAMVALAYFLSAMNLLWWTKNSQKFWSTVIGDLCAVVLIFLSLLTYNAPLVLVPLLVMSIVIDRGVKNWRRWARPVALISTIWLAFMIYFLPLTLQKSKITLFGDATVLAEYGQYRTQFHEPLTFLLGNKYVFYGEKMFRNYVVSWSPTFLMENIGGHSWHAVSGSGYLYWSIYLLGWLGLLTLGGQILHKPRQLSWLFLFLSSLLPVIITVNAPQATRSLLFLFGWCYFAAGGWCWLESLLIKKFGLHRKVLLQSLLWVPILIEFVYYICFYFGTYAHSATLQSMFQPGFDTMIEQVDRQSDQPVAIVDSRGFTYIMLAWYLRLDPALFFSTIKKQQPDQINFKYGEQVGRYHFITRPTDRRPEERMVMEWNALKNVWEIKTY